jgi:hypothetical protein
MTVPRTNLVLSDLGLKAVLVVLLLFLTPHLDSSATEVVTAVTNLPLVFVSLVAVMGLYRRRINHPLRAWVWTGMFGGLAFASGAGIFAHGISLDPLVRVRLWHCINAALALTVTCFAAGAVLDGWGEQATYRVLPGLLAVSAGFFAYATFRSESFLPFIIYEGAAMLFCLAVYMRLTAQRRLAGAGWMSVGTAITMLAAVLQATRAVTFTLVVPFDHNAVFHLVQLPGLVCLSIGLQRGFNPRANTSVTSSSVATQPVASTDAL